MALRYDGRCRRIDLNFRAKYPYLSTRIFKLTDTEYQIYVVEDVDNFSTIAQIFDQEIRFATAPVKLVKVEPAAYQLELECISDISISSNFEGLPLTLYQLYNHITAIHPNVKISKIDEDHNNRVILVDLVGRIPRIVLSKIQKTVDNLSLPYSFEVNDGFDEPNVLAIAPKDEVFNILPSQSQRHLNCPFLERDEKFWFENVDRIYNGTLTKEDLFFFESGKTSCFVDFSVFPNINTSDSFDKEVAARALQF